LPTISITYGIGSNANVLFATWIDLHDCERGTVINVGLMCMRYIQGGPKK